MDRWTARAMDRQLMDGWMDRASYRVLDLRGLILGLRRLILGLKGLGHGPEY